MSDYIVRNTSILSQLESTKNKQKADQRLKLLTDELKLKADAIKHSGAK